MKRKQINGIKYKVFEEDELKYKLNMKDEELKIILEYQLLFPELLQDIEGFCIDARKLHKQFKLKKDFSDWIKTQIDNLELIEGINYTTSKGNCTTMRPKACIDYYFNIDSAEDICMTVGTGNRTNKETKLISKMVRQYFKLLAKTLRNYEEWIKIREPEKEQAKIMKKAIQDWCNRKSFDSTLETFYSREFNMLNNSLTGHVASELRTIFECKNEITRDNLTREINEALLKLEEFNIQLLMADMSFDQRKEMIENVCKNQYNNIKELF